MNNLMAPFLFLVLSLCISCCKVDGRSKHLLDEQHNFTVSESIMHQVDNDFDCVDIYKQPALQHPLLKNHKIQLNPTFARNAMESRPSYIGKAFEECPAGKVPIYKRTRRHQIMANSSSKLQIEDYHQYSLSHPGYHFATLYITQDTTFHGANAMIGVYNLSLQANQYSLSSVWLESGPPSELNSIQVGTGVNPSLYGDSQLRLTAYWTADGFKKTGCFDTQCPGFVQVNSDRNFALGVTISPVTPIGSFEKNVQNVKIKQDQSTGHWWLIVDASSTTIGYWPKELFTHLSTGASLVRYGGETFAPPNMVSPPMGSGRLPKERFENSGFIAKLEIVDSEYNEIQVKREDMKSQSDTGSDCYDLWYRGYQGDVLEQAFLYGGPGGQCGI